MMELAFSCIPGQIVSKSVANEQRLPPRLHVPVLIQSLQSSIFVMQRNREDCVRRGKQKPGVVATWVAASQVNYMKNQNSLLCCQYFPSSVCNNFRLFHFGRLPTPVVCSNQHGSTFSTFTMISRH